MDIEQLEPFLIRLSSVNDAVVIKTLQDITTHLCHDVQPSWLLITHTALLDAILHCMRGRMTSRTHVLSLSLISNAFREADAACDSVEIRSAALKIVLQLVPILMEREYCNATLPLITVLSQYLPRASFQSVDVLFADVFAAYDRSLKHPVMPGILYTYINLCKTIPVTHNWLTQLCSTPDIASRRPLLCGIISEYLGCHVVMTTVPDTTSTVDVHFLPSDLISPEVLVRSYAAKLSACESHNIFLRVLSEFRLYVDSDQDCIACLFNKDMCTLMSSSLEDLKVLRSVLVWLRACIPNIPSGCWSILLPHLQDRVISMVYYMLYRHFPPLFSSSDSVDYVLEFDGNDAVKTLFNSTIPVDDLYDFLELFCDVVQCMMSRGVQLEFTRFASVFIHLLPSLSCSATVVYGYGTLRRILSMLIRRTTQIWLLWSSSATSSPAVLCCLPLLFSRLSHLIHISLRQSKQRDEYTYSGILRDCAQILYNCMTTLDTRSATTALLLPTDASHTAYTGESPSLSSLVSTVSRSDQHPLYWLECCVVHDDNGVRTAALRVLSCMLSSPLGSDFVLYRMPRLPAYLHKMTTEHQDDKDLLALLLDCLYYVARDMLEKKNISMECSRTIENIPRWSSCAGRHSALARSLLMWTRMTVSAGNVWGLSDSDYSAWIDTVSHTTFQILPCAGSTFPRDINALSISAACPMVRSEQQCCELLSASAVLVDNATLNNVELEAIRNVLEVISKLISTAVASTDVLYIILNKYIRQHPSLATADLECCASLLSQCAAVNAKSKSATELVCQALLPLLLGTHTMAVLADPNDIKLSTLIKLSENSVDVDIVTHCYSGLLALSHIATATCGALALLPDDLDMASDAIVTAVELSRGIIRHALSKMASAAARTTAAVLVHHLMCVIQSLVTVTKNTPELLHKYLKYAWVYSLTDGTLSSYIKVDILRVMCSRPALLSDVGGWSWRNAPQQYKLRYLTAVLAPRNAASRDPSDVAKAMDVLDLSDAGMDKHLETLNLLDVIVGICRLSMVTKAKTEDVACPIKYRSKCDGWEWFTKSECSDDNYVSMCWRALCVVLSSSETKYVACRVCYDNSMSVCKQTIMEDIMKQIAELPAALVSGIRIGSIGAVACVTSLCSTADGARIFLDNPENLKTLLEVITVIQHPNLHSKAPDNDHVLVRYVLLSVHYITKITEGRNALLRYDDHMRQLLALINKNKCVVTLLVLWIMQGVACNSHKALTNLKNLGLLESLEVLADDLIDIPVTKNEPPPPPALFACDNLIFYVHSVCNDLRDAFDMYD